MERNLDELIKLGEILRSYKGRNLYLYVISLDLTYINKVFSYSIGSQLKLDVLNYLKSYNPLYLKDMGGKIVVLLDKPLNKKDISSIEEKYRKDLLKAKRRRLVFIEERILSIPFEMEDLFLKEVDTYLQLKRTKGLIKDSFLKNKLLDFGKTKVVAYNTKELYNLVKGEPLLEYAVYYRNSNKELFEAVVLAYYFYLELSRALGGLFKKEKINWIVDKEQKNLKLEVADIDELRKNLLIWYRAVVLPFYPYLNEELKKLANTISKKIKNLNKRDVEELIALINKFSEKLEVVNIRMPINTHLSVNPQVESWYLNLLKIWFKNENIIKNLIKYSHSKYYLFFDLKKFEEAAYYLIKNLPFNEVYLSAAFLEIDGFNTFNFYISPNSVDKHYNDLLNLVFEALREYYYNFKLTKPIFIPFLLGDEFIFLFLSNFVNISHSWLHPEAKSGAMN